MCARLRFLERNDPLITHNRETLARDASDQRGEAMINKADMQIEEPNSYQLLEKLVRGRHSCRAFSSRPVGQKEIERAFELAQCAPSDCNIQPWHVYLLDGQKLEELRAALYSQAASDTPLSYDVKPIENYSGSFLDRRRDCGWSLYGAVGVERGDREASRAQALENYRFFGAPNVALVTSHLSTGERGVFDTGIYLGNLLLAMQAVGLAAVPQAAIAFRTSVVRQFVAIPEENRLICAVAFGYKEPGHPANNFRVGRAAISESVTFV